MSHMSSPGIKNRMSWSRSLTKSRGTHIFIFFEKYVKNWDTISIKSFRGRDSHRFAQFLRLFQSLGETYKPIFMSFWIGLCNYINKRTNIFVHVPLTNKYNCVTLCFRNTAYHLTQNCSVTEISILNILNFQCSVSLSNSR